MDTLFQPKHPHFQAVGELLQKGEHFGKSGALQLSKDTVLPAAQSGDVASMMQMANVYYTLAGNVGQKGGIQNKLRAVYYLNEAKSWATKAFLAWFKITNLELLELAVCELDFSLHNKKEEILSYGDVHILMSCYAQWLNQVKRRLRQGGELECEIVMTCHRTILRGGPENLKALSKMVIYSLHGIDPEVKKTLEDELATFVTRNYSAAMNKSADRGLIQAVCRVARAIGKYDLAETVAKENGMGDQANKAKIKK